MNITILYPDFTSFDSEKKIFGSFHFGIAAISAVMKQKGHRVSLLHYIISPIKADFILDINKSDPDLICISYTEENLEDVTEWYKWINENFSKIPNIAGGTFPTLSPDDAIGINGAKMICIGEGETLLMDLLDRLNKGMDHKNLPSLWYKENNGNIIKNPIGYLQKNLDVFPKIDVDLFNHKKLRTSNAQVKRIYFKASRGCPFNCTYCASPAIRNLYPNKSDYVRFYSPERTIQILEDLLKLNPGVNTVQFADDILPYNFEWFEEFAYKYKDRIGLPYRCYVHLGLINEKVVKLLKLSGCYRVNCGIESGNFRILKHVYNRSLSLEKMSTGLILIKQYGIQIHGSNIIGYHDETMKEIIDTIKFNAKNPVDIPIVSILNPYNGTKINNILKKSNRLKTKVFYLNKGSRIRFKFLRENQVQFVYSTFRLMVLLYRIIYALPSVISNPIVKIVDIAYSSRVLPFDVFNFLHDKYFNQFILTRIYRRLEKDLK